MNMQFPNGRPSENTKALWVIRIFLILFLVGFLALLLSACDSTLYRYEVTDILNRNQVVLAYRCEASVSTFDARRIDVICTVPGDEEGTTKRMTFEDVKELRLMDKVTQ